MEAWKELLEKANQDLRLYGCELVVTLSDNDSQLDIKYPDTTECYAGGYYEDELPALINEAWAVARLKAKQEKQVVYVFTAEQVWDYEVADTIVKAFATKEAAQKYLHEFVHGKEGVIEDAKKYGWCIEYDEPDLFQAYRDGYYAQDHTECTITECEIEN